MSNLIANLFNFKPYTSSIERRRAIGMYAISLGVLLAEIIGLSFYFILLGNLEEPVPRSAVAFGLLTPIGLLAYALTWRGQAYHAAWTFLVLSLIIFIGTPIFFIETKDMPLFMVAGLILSINFTGLVLPPRQSIYFTALAFAGVTLAFVFGGLRMPGTTDEFIIVDGFSLIVAMLLSGLMGYVYALSSNLLEQAAEAREVKGQLALIKTSNAIAQRILSRNDLESILTESVESIRQQFDKIYHAQVFLIDSKGEKAVLRASTGEVGQQLIQRRHALAVGSQSVIGQVTKHAKPILVTDAMTDPTHRVNELLPNTLTELALPLRAPEGVIGALDVQSTLRDAFTPQDVEALQGLADQIAIAVENGRLLQTAQEEAQRSRAIAEATQLTSRLSTDFEQGLAALFETITQPGAYTHWWFGLIDENGGRLRRVTSHRSQVTALLIPPFFDLAQDQNSLTYAYEKRQTVIVNTPEQAKRYGLQLNDLQNMYGKHLAAPVFSTQGEVIGVLLVGRGLDAPNLGERDQELADIIANQVSIALQNAELFRKVEAEQKRLQAVVDTMPIGVLVVDRTQTIQLANEEARKLLGARTGASIKEMHRFWHMGNRQAYRMEELPLMQALQKGQVASAEDMFIQPPNSPQRNLLSKAAPIFNSMGEVEAAVAVFQDVSDLRGLERALQESLSETTKLYEVSRAISHAKDIQTVANAILNQVLSLNPSQVFIILRDESQKHQLSLLAAWPNKNITTVEETGLPPALLLPDRRVGTANLTYATPSLTLIPGIDEKALQSLKAKGVASLILLPLETRANVFGSVLATFQQERPFTQEEKRFLLTLADQAAIAMDAAQSFQNTQDALRSLSRLYEASRSIAETQDLSTALRVIKDHLQQFQPDFIELSLIREFESGRKTDPLLRWARDPHETRHSLLYLVPWDDMLDPLPTAELYVENAAHLPPYRDYQLLAGLEADYQTVFSVPLRNLGQGTGRLNIAFKSLHPLSESDKQFLRVVADSATYIIQNDILFRQTQESLEETGILYQAIRAFADTKDQQGILQAIIDYAADPVVDKALLCSLLSESWDSPNALMEVTVSWVRGDSVDLTGMRFTPEQFPSWKQISTPTVLTVDDVMQDPSLDDTARMGYRALDINSFAIIPLVVAEKPIGVILLASSQARTHTQREIRVYESLTDQVTITLENLRLLEESQRRARQLAASARVSQAASSILEMDELLPEIVELIKSAFGYDQVQVFLISEDNRQAVLKASTGEAGRQLLSIKHQLEVGSRSVIGTVTASGKPSIALDTADARVVHKPNPYLPNTRSEMAIPLMVKGRILGALDVQSNLPGAFTDNDLRVLSVLADQLAIAIENARLFELSRRRSEEMGFLFTVAAESTSANSLDEILERVSELLLQQTNATLVVAYIYDASHQSLRLGAVASIIDTSFVRAQPLIHMGDADPVAQAAERKMPIIIQDNSQNKQRRLRSSAMKAGLYMPLITADSLAGVLALESDQAGKFTDDVLNLLLALTGSLAAVIQNARLLEDIRAANERLREIDKLKTNFLAAMSHELRTPLNSIIGFSRVILKGIDGPINDTQRTDLQTIHESGKHLLGLVNDILDQAKIEAGKMELAKEYFDLAEQIRGVISTAIGLTKDKNIRLNTEIAPNLPLAFGDKNRTRQILLNLVSNAAKFTEKGSITTSAVVVQEGGRPFIRVSVTDTGIGIKAEDFGKLFESFQQVDNTTTRSAEGTGLGLPLAKSLAELQGGKITVESEFGVGSTFSVLIPMHPPDAPLELDEPSPLVAKPNGHHGSANARLIVVLDDNPDMLGFYQRHLSLPAYETVGTQTLTDAMTTAMMGNALALILNVDMQNNQGWEYLREIQGMNLPHPLPIIATSLSGDVERSLSLGAKAHLTRPFMPEELLQAIQKLENRVTS
jgi:GAF domain-containing protein